MPIPEAIPKVIPPVVAGNGSAHLRRTMPPPPQAHAAGLLEKSCADASGLQAAGSSAGQRATSSGPRRAVVRAAENLSATPTASRAASPLATGLGRHPLPQLPLPFPAPPIPFPPIADAACPRAAPPPPLPGPPPAGEATAERKATAERIERLQALRRLVAPSSAGPSSVVPSSLAHPLVASTAAASPLSRERHDKGRDDEKPDEGQNSKAPLPRWRLGAAMIDRLLGPNGLGLDGLHEVKPALTATGGAHAGDWAAAMAFMLRLVLRRLCDPVVSGGTRDDAPAVLWCQPRHAARELGSLYAPGLQHLGLAPGRIVIVETGGRDETLWAIEEGLASGALAVVAGIVDDIALTPARRLALRAARSLTPCLVLTSPRAPAAAATATRWRIARHPGAPHPCDPRAPGAARYSVALQRCRRRPLLGEAASFTLEWSDAAHRFDMASGLADRADDASASRRRVA